MMLLTTASAEEADTKVALISARGSGIEAMNIRDVRRLYLGFAPAGNKSVKNPVLNVQSESVYDDFLKNIMHMTEGSYKRKLVKRIFRQGGRAITEVSSLKELNDHLLKNVGDISFIEFASVENMENVEVIQILW
jgi:hypothetical protein